VVEASDGIDGVTRAHESRPAVILMDLNMPRLDGCSAIARLRSQASTADIPVIVLTGEHESPMLDHARLADCASILHKPCSPDLVLSEILAVLAGAPPESNGP
jgi:CheY-like chemotaxis protein